MNLNITTMKKSEPTCSDVSMDAGASRFYPADKQWEQNSRYLQRLVGELIVEMTPLIQKLEEQLDDEWDRFQEHRGEFARSFLGQLKAFSSTSYKNPDQFYQSVRRIASMWATLSKAQKGLDSGRERERASEVRKYANL
jgi:hypothetical protein